MSPVGDISKWITPDGLEYSVNRYYKMGEGKLKGLSIEQLRAELTWAFENINPQKDVKNTTVPILVIAGSEDTSTPPEITRALYETANEPKKWVLISGANHSFSEHRIPLIDNVVAWMK